MTTRSGPIYEVTFFADRDVVDECDQWLEDHVRETLRDAGVADCYVFPIVADNSGREGRVCHHILEPDAELDAFLDGPAADIETEIASRFGDQVALGSRVLREDDGHDALPGETPNCLNCGTRLRGQYCGHCGQRSRSRLIRLWELISDAFGDLFEIDSRLWQTLVPLLTRPGRLTYDYLQGRRARFMPPFRMYLVMSLIFFVVAFFDPREELGILFEPPTESESLAAEDAASRSPIVEFDDDDEDEGSDDDEDDCVIDKSDVDYMPEFLARRFTVERMTRVCERITADEGKSLTAKVLDSVPTALIVLLPLMALVQKALHPLSRRYYVEHLLFFVHFHAFVFLVLTLQILFTRLAESFGIPDGTIAVIIAAVCLYILIYLFVAMRKVYGQGRFVTFLKYIVLMISYVTGLFIMMLATLAIAAFSI